MQAVDEERKDRERQKRQERKERQRAKQSPEWKGFVTCELTEAHKKSLREGAMSYEEAWEGLMEILPEGYKLSLSYDTRNDTFVCSLTGGAGAGGNSGWCLTGRGSVLDGAVVSTAFKHFIVLEREWGRAGERAGGVVIDFG